MHRTLIAGGGDLGQRLAHRLLSLGVEVHALRRQPPADPTRRWTWHAADVTQPTTLGTLPAHFHSLFYILSPGSAAPAAYRATYVQGLANLLDRVGRPDLRVFFVSSSSVYGEHHGQWVNEDTPCQPLGDNGRILLEAEDLVRKRQPRTTILRLSGLYGNGLPRLFERLRSGSVSAPRQPVHWANRIHRDDAAAALVHLWQLQQPEPLYLGSDDTPLPLHDLYQYLASTLGAPPVPVGPAPRMVGSKRLSNARLKNSGFSFRWPDSREGYRAQWLASQAA